MQELLTETENSISERKPYGSYGNPRLAALKREEKKALIVQALQAQGYRPTDAAALLDISRGYACELKKKESRGLLAPLAGLARRRVKDVLKGTPISNTDPAKTSDVLKAVELVRDEVSPKINRQEIRSLHANIEVSDEDKQRFMAMLFPVSQGDAQCQLPTNSSMELQDESEKSTLSIGCDLT